VANDRSRRARGPSTNAAAALWESRERVELISEFFPADRRWSSGGTALFPWPLFLLQGANKNIYQVRP